MRLDPAAGGRRARCRSSSSSFRSPCEARWETSGKGWSRGPARTCSSSRSGCRRSRRSGPPFPTPSSSAPDLSGPFGSPGLFLALLGVILAGALWLSGSLAGRLPRGLVLVPFPGRLGGLCRLPPAHAGAAPRVLEPGDAAEDLPAGGRRGGHRPRPVSVRRSALFLLLRSSGRAPDLRSRRERARAALARARRDVRLLPALRRALAQHAATFTSSEDGSSATIRPSFSTSRGPVESGSPRRTPPSTVHLIRLVRGEERRQAYLSPAPTACRFISCRALPEAVSYGPGSPRNPMERAGEIYRSLEKKGSRVVVMNRKSEFANFRPPVIARFEKLFPHSRVIGHFVVRWKD